MAPLPAILSFTVPLAATRPAELTPVAARVSRIRVGVSAVKY